MNVPAAHHQLTPTVPDGLPPGQRPMIAMIRAIPGHEPQLSTAISTLAAAVRAEPGCLEFRPFHDATDPGVFYLYEIYADIDAFRTHLDTRYVAQFFTQAAQHTTSNARALVQLVELPAGDPLDGPQRQASRPQPLSRQASTCLRDVRS